MEMKILLRNKVEQEIEVHSTTELKRKFVFSIIVLNEDTPKTNKLEIRVNLFGIILLIKYNSLIFAD